MTGEVEQILAVSGAPSRRVAAVKALRRGLHIPAGLTVPARADQG